MKVKAALSERYYITQNSGDGVGIRHFRGSYKSVSRNKVAIVTTCMILENCKIEIVTMTFSRSTQGRHHTTRSADDRCLSLHIRRDRTATPAELRFPLNASSGKLLSRLHEYVFMRDEQPFASHLLYAIGGSDCSGYVNMCTELVNNGGQLTLWMSPGFASKAIVGIFFFGEYLELVFIHDTSVQHMHTDQSVSVFGAISLWVDAVTFVSFLVEMLMLTPKEMKSWILMCVFMPGQ
ncbi:hypothetical protein TNCV_2382851 [Trichonephila clavipes]|nr:hypothetical protein TNCV_2382851 [Trichonephila clavipes]